MPLLDHFHPPLSEKRHWESFHARWAAAMADALNDKVLPKEYFAEIQVHVGGRVEVDVGTFGDERRTENGTGGGTATLAKVWAPPAATMTFATSFPDEIEVQVFSTATGPTLVAAIELVSPGNKDRPDARRALAAKCVGYITAGIGLVLVDVVTSRGANLHNEMLEVMNLGAPYLLPEEVDLYAVAYRPTLRGEKAEVDAWPHALAVGSTLPIVPLALRNDGCVPLDLETTYTDARRRSRME